jgi:transposase
MWTDSARAKYARPAKRCAGDLTDAEFALVEPRLPPPNRLGRPRTTDLRAVLDAIFYLLRTGCPSGAALAALVPAGTDDRRCRSWAMLPKGFPPKSTVFGYCRRWWWDGTWLGLYYGLLVLAGQAAGRAAQPTVGIVDSQSVKTTESGGPRGYNAGKKINGRKRHVLVDALGFLLRRIVHPASVQDRDGIAPLLGRIRRRFPWLQLLFADGGYQGQGVAATARHERLEMAIAKRSDRVKGFVVLPKRWIVERSFAWLNRNRRLAKDVEQLIDTSTAHLYLAATRLLTRRLATS